MLVPFSAEAHAATAADTPADARDEATKLTVDAAELVAPVLARVVGALAARRDVTIDRLSDAVLLTDAISADAPAGVPPGGDASAHSSFPYQR